MSFLDEVAVSDLETRASRIQMQGLNLARRPNLAFRRRLLGQPA